MPPADHSHKFTADEVSRFRDDGYVIRKGLFDMREIEALNAIVNTDERISKAVYGLADASGATTELALWRRLGDDMFGAVARSRRIVDNLATVMGGQMAFYHAKLTLKRPKVGGAWDWHQDYGYWYRHGYLYPNMASVFIALDPSRRENGCLQVLKGSHKIGRIDHGKNVDQIGAEMVYVEAAKKTCPLVHAELDPGDALFFHANLLHASGPNTSDRSRNVLLCCYNRADNEPFLDGPTSSHTPIEPLDDDRIADFIGKPLDGLSPVAQSADRTPA
ncbi:MAG: phytanoyl-CoA dioxygenase family protein [Inquilinaceae bacterium]